MKHFFLAVLAVSLTACGPEDDTSTELALGAVEQAAMCTTCDTDTPPPPTSTASWHEFTGYNPWPGFSWMNYDCQVGDFVIPDFPVIITNTTRRCLFAGPVVNVSSLPTGTKLKFVVRQIGFDFKFYDIPFYTHLFLRFGNGALDGQQPQYLPIGDSEINYTVQLTKPSGASTFNPVIGFDPAFLAMTSPTDQPKMEFREVRLYYWQ